MSNLILTLSFSVADLVNSLDMSQSQRPGTSSTRPDTSETQYDRDQPVRRGATAETLGEEEEWSEEDDDPGMFSFLPPARGSPESLPAPHPSIQALTSGAVQHPVVPTNGLASSPAFSDNATLAASPVFSTLSLSPAAEDLTPAAAYALAASDGRSPVSLSRPAMNNLNQTRRRGTWQYPESPTYAITSDPISAESLAVDTASGFRPSLAHQHSTNSQQNATSHADHDLAYKNWEGNSSQSDSSSAMDGGYRMDDLGPSKGSLEAKRMRAGEEGIIDGLDPLDFEGFMDDEEDSPYPEVRASVSNIDDVEMPCLTFRSWGLGLFFTLLVSAVNVFFMFRYPAPIVTPVIVQVVSYPFGKALAYLLPATSWRVPKWMQRLGFEDEFSFNPGPFNIKEHTVIVIMANAATGPAYALNFTVASEKFYGIRQGLAFDFLLLLTTQLIGFGMAGICRKYLVWPAALIWPQNLVFCTLLNTLHAEDDDETNGGVSRFRFFTYVMGGAFLWYFLPGSSSTSYPNECDNSDN